MLRRATIMDRNRILYQVGAHRFFNAEACLHELSEILTAHCLATKCLTTRTFLLTACSTSSSTYRAFLREFVAPTTVPSAACATTNLNEATDWVFGRCQLCGHHHYSVMMMHRVRCLDTGVERTMQLCTTCFGTRRLKLTKVTILRGGRVVASDDVIKVPLMLRGDVADAAAVVALFHRIASVARVEVKHVSSQTYRLKRSYHLVKLEECAIRVAIGSTTHTFRAYFSRSRFKHLASTVNTPRCLAACIGLQCRTKLECFYDIVEKLYHLPSPSDCNRHRRKAFEPVHRIGNVPCMHEFVPSYYKLLTCTYCCPLGTKPRRRVPKRTPD
jgi:hypothetical protein